MKKATLTILLIFCSLNMYSQDVTRDTVRLEEVRVRGFMPPASYRSATPVQSLTMTELERLPGNNVADAIKTLSGVTLKDYGGIGGLKTVMVRSLGSNHTGVFLDGVPFSDAATGQVDLGKINTGHVGEISLFTGQENNLLHTARMYASASIININTTKPDLTAHPLRYKAGLRTGSFGLVNPGVSLQAKAGRRSYTDISFSYIKAHGKYPYRLNNVVSSDESVLRENTDIRSANLNATFACFLSDSSEVSLKVYSYHSERGLPGAVVYYNPFSIQRLRNHDIFAAIRYSNETNRRFRTLTNIKASQNRLRYLDPGYLNAEGKLDNLYLQREYYGSQVMAYRVATPVEISLANDFFINTLTSNTYHFASPKRFTALSSLAIQYSRDRLETNANLLATLVRESTLTGEAAPARNKVSPSFSASYKLFDSPALRLRFLYKDIFRMPTFNDMYYTLVGNNNLLPEKARQYNIGLTGYRHLGIFEYMSFTSDVFYNKVSDKIVAIPTKNLFVWSMQNIGEADIRGLELQAQLRTTSLGPGFRFSQNLSYTFQRAMDVTSPGSATYKKQIPYIPLETFASLSGISYHNLTLNYQALFNGYRYVLGENIYQNMIPSWWISDVSILCDVAYKDHQIGIKGEINNLYNKQYEVIRSFPMPGRAYFISLTINY